MYLYYLGIIDYLQDFNFSKWGENKFKSMKADGDLISSVPPPQYSMRFMKFMQETVITDQSQSKDEESTKLKTSHSQNIKIDFSKTLKDMQKEKFQAKDDYEKKRTQNMRKNNWMNKDK